MPKRTPANSEEVLGLYTQLGSAREVARQMGLHENTVYAILKRHRGECVVCGQSVAPGAKHCKTCQEHIRERMRVRRAERRRAGVCSECDRPIEPPSIRYCNEHRLAHQARSAKYHQTTEKRGTPQPGVPTQKAHDRMLRAKYGAGGIAAWYRDGGCCVVCGVPHHQKSVSVHHIDSNQQNNDENNLVCLCFRCHRLTHLLIEHPDPDKMLSWARRVYPNRGI
jgi:DNA-binding CsgD family transcriptional regulator